MKTRAALSLADLRQAAEAQLKARPDATAGLSADDLRQRLHELEVQQLMSAMRQEEALGGQQENTERMQLAVKAANIGLWDWDLATNEVVFSKEWKAQLGYAENEIRNEFSEWECRTHPDDLGPVLERIRRYIAQPVGAHEAEFRMKHKDGSWRWIYARAEVVFGAEGKPDRMLGCHVDITARKQMENALKRSEDRFRLIMESGMIGMLFWNEAGEITQANDAFLGFMGYTHEDVTAGRVRWRDMTPPEYRSLDENALREMALTGICQPFEKEYFHQDGRRVSILVGGAMFPGQPVQGVAFILDITDRKRTESRLRVSDQALKAISQGVIVTDAQQRMISANQAFVALTGYTEGELLGRNCRLLQGPLSDRKRVEEIRQALAAGVGFAGEVINHRKDGSAFLNELTISPVRDEQGQLTHFIGVTRDITARKEAERVLVESREQLRALLARLQRTREEERLRISREIHDELGQLLTGLKMDVRWLERRLSAPGLPVELNPLLDRAVAASELADATIATVQKIAAELRPGALDQLGLAAAMTQELRRLQERRGLLYTARVVDPVPALSAEVAAELFYIFQEALTNVIRHGRATQVDVFLEVREGMVELEVCDDGVGMAEAELSASHSLGLLGMKERAAQCGGSIGFARREPHGLRVTVRIPQRREA